MQQIQYAGVISLPSSPLRLRTIRKSAPLELTLVPGVDGRAMTAEEIRGRFDTKRGEGRYGRPLFRGEIGCTLAHIEAMHAFLEATKDQPNDTLGLICEDDLIFGPDAERFLRDVRIAHPHELTFLVRNYPYPEQHVETVGTASTADVVRPLPVPHGAMAYLISRAAARLITQADRPFWIADDYQLFHEMGIDVLTVRSSPLDLQNVPSEIDGADADRLKSFGTVGRIRTRGRGTKSFLTRFGQVSPEATRRWHRRADWFMRLPFALRSSPAGRCIAMLMNDMATGHTLPQRLGARFAR